MEFNIKKYLDFALKAIYPDKCIFCQKVLPISYTDLYLCDDCCKKLPLYKHQGFDKGNDKFAFDEGISFFHYQDMRDSLFALKYYNCADKGKYMAELMYDCLDKTRHDFLTSVDLVVPIPLHDNKFKNRGYNQSHIIGERFAQLLGINYSHNILKRIHDTAPQSKLSHDKRFKNIENAFSVDTTISIDGMNILLIDDIFTTGSTLNECAKVLKMHGAEYVHFCTVAASN